MTGVTRLPHPEWSAPGTKLAYGTYGTWRSKTFRTEAFLQFLCYLTCFMPNLLTNRRIDGYLMHHPGKGINDKGFLRPLSECLMPEQCVQLQLPLVSLWQIGTQG